MKFNYFGKLILIFLISFNSCTPNFSKSIFDDIQWLLLARILGLPILYVNVSGLNSPSNDLILINNNDSISINSDGTYRFNSRLEKNSNYNVVISQNVGNHSCIISNGSGTVQESDVSNVTVTCVAEAGSSISTNVYFDRVMVLGTLSGSYPTAQSGTAEETTSGNVGAASLARYNSPRGTTFFGNNLYIADSANHTIRKLILDSNTPTEVNKTYTIAGTVGVAGTTDGTGTLAQFNSPMSLASDSNYIYIADTENHCIRMMDPSTLTVTTLVGICGTSGNVDGNSSVAQIHRPIFLETNGNILLWTELDNKIIKKFNLTSKITTTLISGFSNLIDGANIYYAASKAIYRMDFTGNGNTFVAGNVNSTTQADGVGSAAGFNDPFVIGGDITYLYIIDSNTNMIRRIHKTTFNVETLFTSSTTNGYVDGPNNSGGFCGLTSGCNAQLRIVYDNIVIPDYSNHSIRVIRTNLRRKYSLAGNANDDTVNAQHGIMFGGGIQGTQITSTSNQNNVSGGALQFNGSSDYVVFNSGGLPLGSNSRSVCAWIYIDQFPTAGLSNIVAWGNGANSELSSLTVKPNGNLFAFDFSGLQSLDSVSPLSLNTWTHVCMVYNGSTLTLYINGAYNTSGVKSWNTTNGSGVGAIGGLNTGSYFKGRISDVRIYAHPISATDVNTLYLNP